MLMPPSVSDTDGEKDGNKDQNRDRWIAYLKVETSRWVAMSS